MPVYEMDQTGRCERNGCILIEIMPLMFIPAAVGLITSWNIIRPKLLAYAAITVISTLLVMLVSGYVTDWMLKGEKKGEDK